MCIFKMYNLICCFYQSVYISISMKLSPQSDNGHVHHLTSLFMTFYSTSSLVFIFSLPVQPLNCLLSWQIDLHFLEFCVSGITQHILFLFGFFQLVCFFCTSFMVVHISIDQSFPWQSCILLYRYTVVCLSIHRMMNMEVVFSWGYYKCSWCEYSRIVCFFFKWPCAFHFLWVVNMALKVCIYLPFLANCQIGFQNGFYHFTFPLSVYERPSSCAKKLCKSFVYISQFICHNSFISGVSNNNT